MTTKYKIDISTNSLIIDGKEFEVVDGDFNNNKYLMCETEAKALYDIYFTILDYPLGLEFNVESENGFDTFLFYDLYITKKDSSLHFDFTCSQPNKYWEGNWGLSTFITALSDIARNSTTAFVENLNILFEWKELTLRFIVNEDFNFKTKLDELTTILRGFIKQTELLLSGVVWRKEFDTNENLYCTDLLYPLLRKMGYIDVRYTHGTKEYGKDFTFSEQTKFGNLRHFALQAKAGNIRGNVNSQIDEIIGQLEDAFSMPYHEISANEERQISTFIIAISGQFTDNAKDKIIEKIPKHFRGSVYFIDRDKTNELIEKYWNH